jgi:flavin reductase (DIM6/NTAB) family NADH-FMN oxidoreductase RutF
MSDPSHSDPTAYRRALGHYATGVVIVTADQSGETSAITVNSFVSISLEPRLLMWSLACTRRSKSRPLERRRFAAAGGVKPGQW